MSANNWTNCPACLKRAKKVKEQFEKKYKEKLDSYIYGDIIKELDRKIEYLKYSESEFKPNKKVLVYAQENDLSTSSEFPDVQELLDEEETGVPLRENYEQGVDDTGKAHAFYKGSCDCGFSREIKINNVDGNINIDCDKPTENIIYKYVCPMCNYDFDDKEEASNCCGGEE